MPITQSANNQSSRASLADIVFLIDSSGSMKECYEGLKTHIGDFATGLESNPAARIDYRLGILSAGRMLFQKKGFSSNQGEFTRALDKMTCSGGDELTLPALDWALDFEWRHGVHKVVILFTDEPVRAKLFIFGPQCPEFKRICKEVPACLYTQISDHAAFFGSGFGSVLNQIGKTVSQSCGSNLQLPAASGVAKDIYGLLSMADLEIENVTV